MTDIGFTPDKNPRQACLHTSTVYGILFKRLMFRLFPTSFIVNCLPVSWGISQRTLLMDDVQCQGSLTRL